MELQVMIDTVWVLVCAMLVFFMNLGFGCVEAGFCRTKNAVNILSKNFIVFAAATLSFYAIGWGLMFGDGNGFVGTQGLFGLAGADNSPAKEAAYQGVYSAISWAGVPLMAKFFFQLVFAGTAATIVSGCVAERIKYFSFIVFSFVIVGLIYPIVGHWIWGGGWLAEKGFLDFAGSTQVHSIGGWAGLVAIIVLGPRYGKYGADGSTRPIPGHNLPLATIGAFVLWLGWFGFNPGSTMAVDPGLISHICVTTNAAATTAMLLATVASTILLGKPDLGMSINGCLAGLVAITASCAFVSVPAAILIGAIAGVLVVVSVVGFDRMRIDDPVGALSVHLVCGVFGTLAVGIWALPELTGGSAGLFAGGGFALLGTQFLGVVSVAVFVLSASFAVWTLLKATLGIRVSVREEIEGLDIGEHGNSAYPEMLSRNPWHSAANLAGKTE
ncbi:MAG: ammonium transporter [Candidatus Omnitrophica bacterium]|nr:ammonium transporter [Candidatus Omnitrophota bacterium]